jgi:hypothetical protein
MDHDPVEPLKPFAKVVQKDELWNCFVGSDFENFYARIDSFQLHNGVPVDVRQHFENARNTWLYSFFAYRLLQTADLQLHVAGEAAIRERAKLEGIKPNQNLAKLLTIAIEQRWLVDTGFSVTQYRAEQEAEHIETMKSMGVHGEAFVGPLREQNYSVILIHAFRFLRNSVAHGEVMLQPNLSGQFRAMRDMINQLFPEPTTPI